LVSEGVSKTYTRGKQAVPVLEKLDLEIPWRFPGADGPPAAPARPRYNRLAGCKQRDRRQRAHRPVVELPAAHWRSRHVGFVFQFCNLPPVRPPRRTSSCRRATAGKAQRLKHVETALEIVGLKDRAKHSRSVRGQGSAWPSPARWWPTRRCWCATS
jgi:putative ABC transport system ATP-binding protein